MHAADAELEGHAGALEFLMQIGEPGIAVAQQHCAQHGLVDQMIERKSGGKKVARFQAEPLQRRGAWIGEDLDVAQARDGESGQNSLAAIVRCPVELAEIGGRRRAIEHSQHTHNQADI